MSGGRVFFGPVELPVFCNVLWDSASEARGAARAALRLVHCGACGLIWNDLFDARKVEYAPNYENALHFSAHFRAFAQELAERLVREHELGGKAVVEIGCGDGMFLGELVKAGAGRGVGFDPSMKGRIEASAHAGVTIHPELFTRQTAPAETALVVCRHVLEHIERPVEFLGAIREAVAGRDVACYFEVPNAGWMLREGGVWDILYEHVAYYTPGSLEALLDRCGFGVMRTEECYGGQFVGIDARTLHAGPAEPSAAAPARELFERFGGVARERVARWRQTLEELGAAGRRAAVWGAGTKGGTFLNMMGAAAASVEMVIDQNPRKHGRHIAGVGTTIAPPEALRDSSVDMVIVMNPVYVPEIGARLAQMGVRADMVTA